MASIDTWEGASRSPGRRVVIGDCRCMLIGAIFRSIYCDVIILHDRQGQSASTTCPERILSEMNHSDLNAAMSKNHRRSAPTQMQPVYAVPFFTLQPPQFAPQPFYSLRSPFAPQSMQPPYAQMSPYAPKQEHLQFTPNPLYSTPPLYQLPPYPSQSQFNLPPQYTVQPVADSHHPFKLKSELRYPCQPQLKLEEEPSFTSKPKLESQSPLNLKLKPEVQPPITSQPKLESGDMFELQPKWEPQSSLSPPPELEEKKESKPALVPQDDTDMPQTLASKPLETRGRNTDPTPSQIFMVVQVKMHLLVLAVEHEAWRQVYGEDHKRVTELAVRIMRLKQILNVTNILSSEFTENQRMIMLEEANFRATWLRCSDSTRSL